MITFSTKFLIFKSTIEFELHFEFDNQWRFSTKKPFDCQPYSVDCFDNNDMLIFQNCQSI